ncbi:MAG: SHOCT domain-containing protein [Variovorax sp.]|nr:SHOCT domain-containing protein [Variovorax sp.]
MSNFWDLIQLLLSTFVLIVYLLILFQIIGDLFRDSELGGGYKVLWIIFLVILPGLTAIAYIITRGRGMAERQRASLARAKSDTDAYIRQVAGKSPAEQIADAKALLDAGTITQQEFETLKAKALA